MLKSLTDFFKGHVAEAFFLKFGTPFLREGELVFSYEHDAEARN